MFSHDPVASKLVKTEGRLILFFPVIFSNFSSAIFLTQTHPNDTANMLSQLELQYDDCKPRCRGTIIMNRCWKSSSGWSVEGRLAVLSVFGSQSRRTVITLRSQYDNISVCPWPTTDPGLLSDPQPNHAVLLPLALQLWVPNGHFHCAEVKTEWSVFHLLFYREKMICTCRTPLSIIVNNISSGCFRQLVFVIFSPNITKAD